MEPTPQATAIQYVGRKAQFTDRLYGSGLTFLPGQVRAIPSTLARSLLRHQDSFVEAAESAPEQAKKDPAFDDTQQQLEQADKANRARDKERDELQDLRDQIGQMDKEALELYARTNFRQELDRRKSLSALRQQVTGMVDQFGAA